MAVAPPGPLTGTRRPALLLVATVPAFIAYAFVAITNVALGSATFADTVGPPAFLLGLLWAALGIRMARELRSAE